MFLTQGGGLIMKPISKLLGAILNLIYEGLSSLGVINIGFSIILVTFLIRACMVPMMFKQNRTSKIMNYIQPEMNKIAKKYRNKKDQQSMLAQQQETRELQEKYGASMTGGCLSSLIQLPIFMAMYRVIQNIPAYVHQVKDLYDPIAQEISKNQSVFDKFSEFCSDEKTLKSISFVQDKTDTIIDVLSKFSQGTWERFQSTFEGTGVANIVSEKLPEIHDRYNFFGIDLTTAPGFALTIAIIIPILSFIFQYLSMHVTPQQAPADPAQEQTMKTMKTMLNVMPLMSLFICITVPAGLGLYWATGSLVSFLTSVSINAYFKHKDMDEIVEKSKEKAAKKIAKRKAKGKKTFFEKMQESANGGSSSKTTAHVNSNVASTSLKNYSSSTMNSSGSTTKYKAGSLASKANAMQRYNNKDK